MGKMIESNDKTIESTVDDFAKNISCLDEVYEELSRNNFFEILKTDKTETIHDNMLEFLLDPHTNSGFGSRLLKRFVSYCAEYNDMPYLSPTMIETKDMDNVIVERGKHDCVSGKKIDLLIHSRDNSLVICIENRINSSKRKGVENEDGRLEEFYHYVEREYKDYQYRYFVFLTPDGVNASDPEKWISLSYYDISRWINTIMGTYRHSIPQMSQHLIQEYIDYLENNVIYGPFKEMCDRVYMSYPLAFNVFEGFSKPEMGNEDTDAFRLYCKHKEAIDTVLNNKINITEKIKATIARELRNRGYITVYDPKRAPIIIKTPEGDINPPLVKPGYSVMDDYIYLQIYYAPSEDNYYLNMCTDIRNKPEGPVLENLGKCLGKEKDVTDRTMLLSKRLIPKSSASYYDELSLSSRNPKCEDEFVQNICDNMEKFLQEQKYKSFCEKLEEMYK